MKALIDMQTGVREITLTMSYDSFIQMMSVITTSSIILNELSDETLKNAAKDFLDEYEKCKKMYVWDED